MLRDSRKNYPALTPYCTQAHWFEREIHEMSGRDSNRASVAEAYPFYVNPNWRNIFLLYLRP